MLSIYGGKLTTYRRLAEHALKKLKRHLPMGPAWTAQSPPAGRRHGRFRRPSYGGERAVRLGSARNAAAPRQGLRHPDRSGLLSEAQSLADLGENFGGDLYEAELDYLRENEFARSAEDVLWRRSKLGLHLPSRQHRAHFARWFDAAVPERLTSLDRASRAGPMGALTTRHSCPPDYSCCKIPPLPRSTVSPCVKAYRMEEEACIAERMGEARRPAMCTIPAQALAIQLIEGARARKASGIDAFLQQFGLGDRGRHRADVPCRSAAARARSRAPPMR